MFKCFNKKDIKQENDTQPSTYYSLQSLPSEIVSDREEKIGTESYLPGTVWWESTLL